MRIIYNSILKKKCTTYISLLSFEEVLSTLYFSAVWRMMMIRDDQFGGPIMNNNKKRSRWENINLGPDTDLITVSFLIHPHCTWDKRNGTGMGEGCECLAV